MPTHGTTMLVILRLPIDKPHFWPPFVLKKETLESY